MAKKNYYISDAIELIEGTLLEAVRTLNQEDRVQVEVVPSIETFINQHHRGTLAIVPESGRLERKNYPQMIAQDHDIIIGVFPVVKFIKGYKHPSYFVDFILDTLTGIEIFNKRAERKTYCADWSVVKEDHGEWWYEVPVIVPADRFEKDLLNN